MVLAQQQVQPIQMNVVTLIKSGLCVGAAIFVLIFGMWITRPKKQAPTRNKERPEERKSFPIALEYPYVKRHIKERSTQQSHS